MTAPHPSLSHAASGNSGLAAPSGRVVAVLGPTNTGKTHYAIERMLAYQSGMIGLPLRLLAREIYDRVVSIKGAHAVALVTGEEKIVPKAPSYWVTTVESMPLDVSVECLAVDEIQLAADLERGHIFTDRLLRARGLSETLFMGSDTIRPLLSKLIPHIQFITRPRFSDLAYAGPRKLSRLPRRSAIVAFSANSVYAIAELIRRQRGGAAVVMGALSPRTRNAQVGLYQSGEVDFMVATDAVGMGLNMDVDHVAFAETDKFDGMTRRPLKPQELAQIAGRAGRHMNDGTFGTTGDTQALDSEIVEAIENHRFDPLRVVQWRNADLDFSSVVALKQSLDQLPPMRGLSRARAADDLLAMRLLSEKEEIAALAVAPAAIRILWDVCQVPDFRKVALEEHARLLEMIYLHLLSTEGTLPTDWFAAQVERLDQVEGEIDMIAQRIAHVRTWTYCANRSGWLADPGHWQDRTREIEDKLSDALHEKLTQRFIDRRTSVLMRRLRDEEEFAATVDENGEVLVDGEYVGRLHGFSFVPDPRALGIHGKALRSAAFRGLGSEIADRAHRLSIAPEAAITLSDHGRLWWNGGIVGQLSKGSDPLSPRVELLADELLSAGGRERAHYRLQGWVNGHIDKILGPLMAIGTALKLEAPTSAQTDSEGTETVERNGAHQDGPATLEVVNGTDVESQPSGESGSLQTQPSGPETTQFSDTVSDEAESGIDGTDQDAALEPETHADTNPGEGTAGVPDAPLSDDSQTNDKGGLSGGASSLDASASIGAVAAEPAKQKGGKRKKDADPSAPEPLTGIARGIAYQLLESLGALPRAKISHQLKAVDQASRGPLRRLGIRFGQYSVFLPNLVKPSAARLKALLWAVHNDLKEIPPAPPAGLTSLPVDGALPDAFLEAAGYRVCGARAVRLDMLERLGDMIRAKGNGGQMPEAFETSADMMSVLGAGLEDLAMVLRGLGYRESERTKDDGTKVTEWRPRARAREPREDGQTQRRGPRKHGRNDQAAGAANGRSGGGRHQGGRRFGQDHAPAVATSTTPSAETVTVHDAAAATPGPQPERRSDRPRERDRHSQAPGKTRHGDAFGRKDGEKTGGRLHGNKDGSSDRKPKAAREGEGQDRAQHARPRRDRDERREDRREDKPRAWSTEAREKGKGGKPADPDSPFAILSQLKFSK